jgi:hypothetical protein
MEGNPYHRVWPASFFMLLNQVILPNVINIQGSKNTMLSIDTQYITKNFVYAFKSFY